MDPRSYTSASTFPIKLLQHSVAIPIMMDGYIAPTHLQLNPTNKCNLKCGFCSCANKDDHEMPYEQATTILYQFAKLGTRAVTITGGGEPLCHPDINKIIRACGNTCFKQTEVGLVTNGILLDKLEDDLDITWCRISASGGRSILSKKSMDKIRSMPQVDWAMSYVLHEHDYANLTNAVLIANELGFSHIRIVDDILGKEESKIGHAKEILDAHGIDTSKCIFQGRKSWKHGTKRCLISLIKPGVDAHGNLYGCCGKQYIDIDTPSLDYGNDWAGDKYQETWHNQNHYDGSLCSRCFYSDYNELLGSMLDARKVEHEAFV